MLLALAALWAAGVAQWRMEWEFNPLYNYGWSVPFLIAYLAWRELEWLPVPTPGGRHLAAFVALAGVLAFLPLRVLLEANPDWRILGATLGLIVVAVTLAFIHRAGGWPWTSAFLPIVGLLLLAMPWSQRAEYIVIVQLTNILASVTVEILNALGLPALQRGNVIEVGAGLVGVAEACSGIRSLQATLMLAAFFGQFYRLPPGRRLFLFPIGLAFAWTTNLARTLILTLITARSGSIAAWHDPAGFGVLGICFVLLWLVALRFRQPDRISPPPASFPAFPQSWSVALLVWVVAVEMGNASWYRWHERSLATVAAPLWRFDWPEAESDFAEVTFPDDERIVLRASESRAATWNSAEGRVGFSAVFLRWAPSRAAAQLAHNHTPEVCFSANGFAFVALLDPVSIETPRAVRTLRFERSVFASGARRLFVFRCLTEDGESTTTVPRTADYGIGVRWRAALEGRRNLGQRSFELTISGPELDAESALAVACGVLTERIVSGN